MLITTTRSGRQRDAEGAQRADDAEGKAKDDAAFQPQRKRADDDGDMQNGYIDKAQRNEAQRG